MLRRLLRQPPSPSSDPRDLLLRQRTPQTRQQPDGCLLCHQAVARPTVENRSRIIEPSGHSILSVATLASASAWCRSATPLPSCFHPFPNSRSTAQQPLT